MLRKIRHWLQKRKLRKQATDSPKTRNPQLFTKSQLENAYRLGYNDGKRDGLTIAREQASNSLKEILWAQNNQIKIK